MSTTAAIFIMDEKNDCFNGVTVTYDGYIKNGVGETLFFRWNKHDKVLDLIKDDRTDIRVLGGNLKETEFFIHELPDRIKKFRNRSYDQMLNEGGNYDYLYVMVPDDNIGWDWKVQMEDGFHPLSEWFPDD